MRPFKCSFLCRCPGEVSLPWRVTTTSKIIVSCKCCKKNGMVDTQFKTWVINEVDIQPYDVCPYFNGISAKMVGCNVLTLTMVYTCIEPPLNFEMISNMTDERLFYREKYLMKQCITENIWQPTESKPASERLQYKLSAYNLETIPLISSESIYNH